MKRFYKNADARACDGGFTVTLDGRAIKTPKKLPLTVTSEALARAIADEWQAQGDKVDPESMPLGRFANTAIDRVASQRASIVAEIADFGGSDLVCYRVDSPDALVAAQARAWDPALAWLMKAHGIALTITNGIVHVPQDDRSLEVFRALVEQHDDSELAALHTLVNIAGSLVIGLAVSGGGMMAAAGFEASIADDLYQHEKWGGDSEAEDRLAIRKAIFLKAHEFLLLHRTKNGATLRT